MRTTQRNLFDQLQVPSEKREQKRRLTHGGAETKGKRKSRRPLATKKWIHLTLKSEVAKGKLSMLAQRNAKWINQLIKDKAMKFGVEVKEFVNMGNHIHFKLRITSRKLFQNFLRSVTTLIARFVTGARKGKSFGKFWQGLAFTRIVETSFEEWQLRGYFTANRIQRQHGYEAREKYLKKNNSMLKRIAL